MIVSAFIFWTILASYKSLLLTIAAPDASYGFSRLARNKGRLIEVKFVVIYLCTSG
jgi:hypothetical protein